MFIQLLRFEAQYQLKQRAFLLFSLLFLLFGLQMGKQGYERGLTIFNSPQAISEITGLFTLGCVFIIMFFTISGILRDKQHNTEQIIFSTAIKKHYYFLSRFLGVFITSTIAFTSFLVGFAITTILPNLDPTLVNPFQILSYLWPFLIIVLPNIFISSAIIFSVSILSKNNTATYVAAILVYVFYFISSIFLNSPIIAQAVPSSPESVVLAALFDPFGLSAMFEQTQFWTPFQRNTDSLSFSDYFMWNRILWVFVSIVLLVTTYLLFSFRKAQQKVKKAKVFNTEQIEKRKYHPVQVVNNAKSQRKAFSSLLTIELKSVFTSLAFIGIMILWIAIVSIEIYSRIHEGGAYNDSLYPFTNLLLALFDEPLTILSHILIIFFSAEIIWRERSLKFNGIIDSTPTSSSAFFLSKFVALILLPLFLLFAGVVVAIVFQVLGGYYNFEFSQYASLLYYPGISFVIYCLIALFIQTLVSNKYLGMFITGLVIIFLGTSFSSVTGIEHSLLLVGKLPMLEYTNMNGFVGITKAYNHLAIYWMLFAGILTFLSFKLWQRGTISSIKFRINQAFTNWSKASVLIGASLLILFIISGSSVYYNTNIESEYLSSNENLNLRESYERQFKKYENLEGLFPIEMKTVVDLYPEAKRYRVEAEYVLMNKSNTALKQVFITEREALVEITIENASLIEHDSVFGTYLFQLEKELLPKETLKYSYSMDKQLKGFETDNAIVNNGSYIMHREFEPILGYRNGMEISNSLEREKRGLAIREEIEITDDHIQTGESYIGKVNYETIVSTQSKQIAIGSGELVKEWQANGRNYYQYKSDELMMPGFAYFSAEYEVKKENYHGIEIEQYYYPSHDFNIDNITESTKQTLDYCITNFGAYPYKHIRIAEIPGHWGFGGFAHPGTISMTEDRLYLVDLRDSTDFDLVAKRTIHEVAHQWFGHILTPKPIEGGAMFLEGFAKYIEAMVMEGMYGKSAVWQISRTANNRYFTSRSYESDQEPPLYKVYTEGYLSYGKNLTAMLALRDLIGEDKVNDVIKTILQRHQNKVQLELTSIEFLEELYTVTPLDYHVLIDDWFKRVITYDLAIEESSYKQLSNGKYEVTLQIDAKRFELINSGETVEIAIDEPIQIGLFTNHPKNINNEDILYLKSHQISGDNRIKIIVDELPTHIAIDPFGTRSDENFGYKVVRL